MEEYYNTVLGKYPLAEELGPQHPVLLEPRLSKTRTLLTRDPLVDRTYQYIDETFGVVRREVYLDIETFQDLGEPDTITITIEPGDTLN